MAASTAKQLSLSVTLKSGLIFANIFKQVPSVNQYLLSKSVLCLAQQQIEENPWLKVRSPLGAVCLLPRSFRKPPQLFKMACAYQRKMQDVLTHTIYRDAHHSGLIVTAAGAIMSDEETAGSRNIRTPYHIARVSAGILQTVVAVPLHQHAANSHRMPYRHLTMLDNFTIFCV